MRKIKLYDSDYIEVSDEICKEILFRLNILRRLSLEEKKKNNKNRRMLDNFGLIRDYYKEMMEIMKKNENNNINN